MKEVIQKRQRIINTISLYFTEMSRKDQHLKNVDYGLPAAVHDYPYYFCNPGHNPRLEFPSQQDLISRSLT